MADMGCFACSEPQLNVSAVNVRSQKTTINKLLVQRCRPAAVVAKFEEFAATAAAGSGGGGAVITSSEISTD